MHEAQAVAALKAGRHVILQKPISNTMEGAKSIVKAARDTGKVMMQL